MPPYRPSVGSFSGWMNFNELLIASLIGCWLSHTQAVKQDHAELQKHFDGKNLSCTIIFYDKIYCYKLLQQNSFINLTKF